MRVITLIVAVLALCAPLLHAAPANAQALRTWVAGVGDDSNACSRTSPCKTLAGAISKTAAGGEISVLDPGGYGGVIITKSISIVSAGIEAGILVDGVTVKAGPADVVHLQGLFFEGAGKGRIGIRILSGASVDIRKSLIRGYQSGAGLGIEIAPAAATHVLVSDCTIAKNTGGIVVRSSGAGTAQVFLDHVNVEHNAAAGIRADGRSAVIRLNRSVVTGNGTGLARASGGSILSFGNNAISGNATDGSPSGTLQLK
jgi:hypothetical protein